MPRAYTLATAALALGVTNKWLDNTLSHFKLPGVHQERQGIARRLTVDSLLTLSVAVTLVSYLDTSIGRAIEIAHRLLAGSGRQMLGPLELRIDLQAAQAQLLERLERAVEMAPTPRRGRPPKSTTGRLD